MPNKKNPRVRNRPRNKANRLKLLENPANNEEKQEKSVVDIKLLENELNDPKESDEDDDDDMPELMEESTEAKIDFELKPNASLEQDPLKNLQNLMKCKFLQKDTKTEKVLKQKETKVKPNQQNVKPGKSKEKQTTTKDNNKDEAEKNAFIQNLQKKMEAIMANGKYI